MWLQCASLLPHGQPSHVLWAAHVTVMLTAAHRLHGGRPSQLEPQTPTQHQETAGPRPASLSFIWGYWGPNCRATCGVAHHSSLTGWERQRDGF